jgi:hypothetical protein
MFERIHRRLAEEEEALEPAAFGHCLPSRRDAHDASALFGLGPKWTSDEEARAPGQELALTLLAHWRERAFGAPGSGISRPSGRTCSPSWRSAPHLAGEESLRRPANASSANAGPRLHGCGQAAPKPPRPAGAQARTGTIRDNQEAVRCLEQVGAAGAGTIRGGGPAGGRLPAGWARARPRPGADERLGGPPARAPALIELCATLALQDTLRGCRPRRFRLQFLAAKRAAGWPPSAT